MVASNVQTEHAFTYARIKTTSGNFPHPNAILQAVFPAGVEAFQFSEVKCEAAWNATSDQGRRESTSLWTEFRFRMSLYLRPREFF